jgi:hypothetical protein
MSAEREVPSPGDQVARLYERAEAEAAQASESLVGSRGFASMLGQLAENAAALTKLGNDAMDLVLHNLRVAGRRDVVSLARQLARTEDKLERVLQELEELRDLLEQRGGRAEPKPERGNRSAKASRADRRGGGQNAPGGNSDASSPKELKASS